MRNGKKMCLLLPALLLISVSLSGMAAAQDRAAAQETKHPGKFELSCVDISGSAVMLENERKYGSNMTCLAIDDGLVFVDCGLFTERAAEFRKRMEARFNKKTIALVLTHSHTDHFFGMGAFADVPVYAATAERPLFEYQLKIDFASQVEGYKRIFPLFDQAVKTARPFEPTHWFGDEAAIGTGKHPLVVRCTGGHTAGCSYVLLPSEGVLVAGDNMQVDYYPYFGDRTNDMTAWIAALEQWENMDIEKVCPGHGRVVDKQYVTGVREYFKNLVAALKKLKAEGIPVREAVASPDLPAGYWPDGLEKPGWFDPAVAGLYRTLPVE